VPSDDADYLSIIDEITEKVLREIQGHDIPAAPPVSGCSPCIACGSCISKQPKVVERVVAAGAERITSGTVHREVDHRIASLIDHTLLKPDATVDEIAKVCLEAKRFGFASVCLNPYYVPLASRILKDSSVNVCTVIGFPLGANRSRIKREEAVDAIRAGARELDMVINIGALKSKDYDYVEEDIREVREVAGKDTVLKVIIETALLADEEKIQACVLSKLAGADFVKTSTGFSKGGATTRDVALMRKVVGEQLGVKASGGIRDLQTAMEMVGAGATRIGASASVKIVNKPTPAVSS
jgi:deoxyribose-phosphate aldolase